MDRLCNGIVGHGKPMSPQLYQVGAYIRLSVEDAAYDSDSVENQHEMLSRFIDHMPGWIAHKFYIDNGFSGGSFVSL